jgi:hypothetical protein
MAVDDVVKPFESDTDQVVGTESSLSNWAGPSVTDFLGRADAISKEGYEGYGGALTAGLNENLTGGFEGIAGLTLPEDFGNAAGMATDIFDQSQTAGEYDPTQVGTAQWDNDWANQYMNPYIQQKLNPQLDELRRQSDIRRQMDNASLTKAGAFGGGRQAIMNSELNDNTARLMNETTGQGYADAYDSAGRMFTSDKDRLLNADKFNEQSGQFAAGLGIDALRTGLDASRTLSDITNTGLNAERNIFGDQIDAGGVERGIDQGVIDADRAQFEEERDDPFKKLEWLQSMYDGMPLESQARAYSEPSWLSQFGSSAGGILDLFKNSGIEIPTWLKDAVGSGNTGGDDTYGGPTEADEG